MNQLYWNRSKNKLVMKRTQNTKLKLNNTKQRIKRANARGAGENHCTNRSLLGKARITKVN